MRDEIDIAASIPMKEYGMVFLKPKVYEGEEALRHMLNRYGKLGYHLMLWHPEEFEKQLNERIRNGESVNLDGESHSAGEEKPEFDDPDLNEIIAHDPCDCPYNEDEPVQCDDDGGGGTPPPDPPFQFEGSTKIIPSSVGPLTTAWTVVLDSNTRITSNHWAWISHESCFRRDGAPTICNYDTDPEAYHPNGPRASRVKSYTTTLSIDGTGSICPHLFSGETKHWARKFYFSVFWGAPPIKPASGGPYC